VRIPLRSSLIWNTSACPVVRILMTPIGEFCFGFVLGGIIVICSKILCTSLHAYIKYNNIFHILGGM
jgi:hypothetical protein